jgi:hypothetical protein
MRERYEMAERVYYHHKKCAASTMLAKLAEIAPEHCVTDDENVYPAPWTDNVTNQTRPVHMLHFSDAGFIDHLGTIALDPEVNQAPQNTVVPDTQEKQALLEGVALETHDNQAPSNNVALNSNENQLLQRKLYVGLRYNRGAIYRTLLVIDVDLVRESKQAHAQMLRDMRGPVQSPSNLPRIALEKYLSSAAGLSDGNVLVYCAPPRMQAKEVDARVEINEGKILPLRVQKESFAYHDDIKVLEQYYEELWRAYVFIAPEYFKDFRICKMVVDAFSDRYDIPREIAYKKVRTHKFTADQAKGLTQSVEAVAQHLATLSFPDLPESVRMRFCALVNEDGDEQSQDGGSRLRQLFDAAILETELQNPSADRVPTPQDRKAIELHIANLRVGRSSALSVQPRNKPWETYATYLAALIRHAKGNAL